MSSFESKGYLSSGDLVTRITGVFFLVGSEVKSEIKIYTNQVVKNAGSKQFSVGKRKYRQADFGSISSGIIKGSWVTICGSSPSAIEKARDEMETHLDRAVNRKINELRKQLNAMLALSDTTWESRTEINPD